MRATRAYIAGFGTAGSLLAGASMVFVLASAVVAFRGWPQVGGTATPASVVVARPHLTASSPQHQRLLAATAPSRPKVSPAGPSRAAGTSVVQQSGQVNVASVPSTRLAVPPVAVAPLPAKPPASAPPCGASCRVTGVTSTVGTVVQNTTGTVGNTVAAAGKALGTTVSGLTNAVATKLAPLSPGLATAVNNVGSSVSGLVNNTASATGQAINGLGHMLSGALSRPSTANSTQ